MVLARGRAVLEGDHALVGRALCRSYSDLVDGWLADLLTAAEAECGAGDVALVAVGGYGRAELSLQSDIDVVLLHDGRADIGALADRVWYPIWDEGVKLGHAVRTPKEALTLAADDLDTATSFLQIRHVAGDADLTDDLARRSLEQWQRRAKRWLEELSRRVTERHRAAGEVAFLLEPDLKEGRGGLRDVHALRWAEAARRLLWEGDDPALESGYDAILSARVELHRRTGRPGDRLLLEEQDGVAASLGEESADSLMHTIAAAARTIAWRSDDAWQRIDASLRGPGWRARRDRAIGPGLVLRDGEVHLTAEADPSGDPSLVLRAASAAAAGDTRIHRGSLDRLAVSAGALPSPWPDDVRRALVDLLLAGHRAIPVVEALDQMGLWVHVLPEWEAVRSKPQRNAYHRFTVDRHLMEACANAASLVARTDRPDLLVLGSLLHDIGKGYPGDHTEVGMELVAGIGERMGLPPSDVDVLVAMVHHHLLLPDVATRRDLADPATIEAVAEAVGDLRTLGLLAALTEADSEATGPAAWGAWKAELVRDLVGRTSHVLAGGTADDRRDDDFPTDEHLEMLRDGRQVLRGEGDRLTVVTADRPGLFSRVTGVLALHGLAVLDAAVTGLDGVALEVLRVESSFGPTIAWDKVIADLEKVLEGRLALQARLAERARVYGGRSKRAPVHEPPRVVVDNRASRDATVVEVHAVDAVGVLYRITRALADLDLNIVSAKVQTLGDRVVDAFYVRDTAGEKVTDSAALVEVERALLHELSL